MTERSPKKIMDNIIWH